MTLRYFNFHGPLYRTAPVDSNSARLRWQPGVRFGRTAAKSSQCNFEAGGSSETASAQSNLWDAGFLQVSPNGRPRSKRVPVGTSEASGSDLDPDQDSVFRHFAVVVVAVGSLSYAGGTAGGNGTSQSVGGWKDHL